MLDYENAVGNQVTLTSNLVQVTTSVIRSSSTVALTRVIFANGDFQETVGPSACFQGGAYVALADPTVSGGVVIDPTQTQEVSFASSYNLGEPIFIRLDDSDQNVDFQVLDTAVVTVSHSASGDSETIRLTETGVNTGIFAGFVPSSRAAAVVGDCVLQGTMDSIVRVDYLDPADGTDAAQVSARLDPVSVVFESRTGTPVSAATIELVDATSGLPAVVYGNDGVSTFPSTITSGTTITDSGGASYVFGPGEYRFPVVPNGSYRIVVTPPSDYVSPSTQDPNDLQLLPGAPYMLGPASFGNSFSQSGPEAFNWDVPVDPAASVLFLQKRTMTTVAAPGDFVRYELTLENASTVGTANNVQIIDQLPNGVRFIPGSVIVDGNPAPDPAISSDLRTIEFNITALDSAETVMISYVIEIIGGKRNDEILNRATAFAAGGLISNEATAMIRLTEDLFRSTGTIIGRIVEGDCSQETFAEDQGVSGIRVYLEDGRYVVTDPGGRFHFEGITPGTHVAQLDTFTVPAYFDVTGCSDNPNFGGRADSQFVKLTPGGLLRADFFLQRKPAPEGRIDLELRSKSTGSADQVGYDLVINGVGNVTIDDISVMVLLPDGVSYKDGSMRVDGENLGDPKVTNGAITFALPDRDGNWTSALEFIANIDGHISGELSTKAIATFDSPIQEDQRTPVAETIMVREPGVVENAGYVLDLKFNILSADLSVEDRLELNRLLENWAGVQDIRITAVGHSDSTPITSDNQHLFIDNYVLSRARARAAVAYIANALNVPSANIQVEGRGPDDPVADNATADGRQKNRRVEMVMSGVRPSVPSFLEVTKASSGAQVTETRGVVPGTEQKSDDEDIAAELAELTKEPAIESLRPDVELLLPKRGFQPAISSIPVSVQHAPDQSVSVWLNGSPVNPLNFDGRLVNAAGSVVISRWRGVDLRDGDNDLRVVISDADGTSAETITRTVYFSGPPIRGELVPEQSILTADGKTKPVLAIRLFDRAGRTSRPGMVGGFRVEEPYRSNWDVQNDRINPLVQIGDRSATYRIGRGGIALIELEPTTRTGEVTVQLDFRQHRDQQIRAWLAPAARDWILVGFAEGTAGHATLSDNVVAAADAGHEDGYYDEGRVAFFAKGQIKGEFLLTLAYDSDRERQENRDGFETVINPNDYYPLYADAAEQRFEAASQRKLYIKLERNQFNALFGDFETGLTITDLARYQRRFNGFKSELRGKNIGYDLFAAESDQSFNRDELRGDGTSGLYQLSQTPIITNSEDVRIEVRDRFDSSVVLETTKLSRFLDYNLDTLNGTLYFKRPIPSRDLNFNPVFIVVEYESTITSTEDVIAGGRGSVHFADNTVEIGATHVNDRTQGAEADLTGVDLRWQINEQTEMKAEYAETNSTIATVEQSGSAHFISLEHNGEKADVRAFLREVDNNYGVGYQSAADQGFRRLGLDARLQFGEHMFAEGEAGWQQNLESKDIRNVAAARLRYERNSFTTTAGVTHASDKFDDGDTRTSDLAELAFTKKIFSDRLTLRASGSTALNTEAESIDFPTRFVFGADYRIRDGVDLIAEYEDASGRDIEAQMTRVGVRAQPWTRTQINSFVTNEYTEFGPRLFANIGLIQGFQLNERWTFDVGMDQSKTIVDPAARQLDPDRELASGSLNQDFTAVNAGALYTAELWSANTRLEMRDSDSEKRTALILGWYRQPTTGHGLSLGVMVYRSELSAGTTTTAADLKFGWAYRLADSKWSFLNRIDLIFDDTELTANREKSWRLINNFNANRRFSAATQMSLQYAFKYVRSNFSGTEYTGYTDLIGFDIRRGMKGRFDMGFNTSIYHSYRSKVVDYGAGLDVGYNFASNMWLTLGYNLFGFHDSDFTQARYTAQGPFLRFSIKADQRTLKNIAGQR